MPENVLNFTAHYELIDEKNFTMEQLRESFFPEGPDEHNWLVASTSGVHGSYTTLDDIEAAWEDGSYRRPLTVLIIHPRTCVFQYGNLQIETKEDITLLRKWIARSLEAVMESQKGNLPRCEG